MMTTAAAILGAVPLAMGQGDGAEIRQPLGITIVGGLLVSQLLTAWTAPACARGASGGGCATAMPEPRAWPCSAAVPELIYP